MKIALDAMGGDFSPQNPIVGAIQALRDFSDVSIIFVGDEERVRKELGVHDIKGLESRIT